MGTLAIHSGDICGKGAVEAVMTEWEPWDRNSRKDTAGMLKISAFGGLNV